MTTPIDFPSSHVVSLRRWLLGMDPDATIDMLVRLYSSGVQPSAVLPILSSFKSELAGESAAAFVCYLSCS